MTTIFFRDYSEYNDVFGDPYPIRISRASIGQVADSNYQLQKAKADVEGDFFMAYHFLNAHQLDNPIYQARFCYKVVGPNVPLMLDHEPNRGYCATMDDAWKFINEYRSLGGILHSIYLPRWTWSGYLGSPDLRPLENAGIHLVSSHYTTYSDDGPGWLPYGGVFPFQWQYTSTPYDTNAFKGTVAEYISIVAPELVNGDDDPVSVLYVLKNVDEYVTLVPPSVASGKACYVGLSTDFTDAVVRPALWYDGSWHVLSNITVKANAPEVELPLIDNTNVRKVSLRLVSGNQVSVSVNSSIVKVTG